MCLEQWSRIINTIKSVQKQKKTRAVRLLKNSETFLAISRVYSHRVIKLDKFSFSLSLRGPRKVQRSRKDYLTCVHQILLKHGIAHDAHWTKSQNNHYCGRLHERVYELIENGNFLTNYNRFKESQWLLAVTGSLKWFETSFENCPACNATFSWNHLILECTAIYHESITQPMETLLALDAPQKDRYSRIIQKRWTLAQQFHRPSKKNTKPKIDISKS